MGTYAGQDLFPTNIYQFEETDVVMGGPDGIDNQPLKELADRTNWLFNRAGRMAERVVTASQTLDKSNTGTLITANASSGTLLLTLDDIAQFKTGAVVDFSSFCALGAAIKVVGKSGQYFWDAEGNKSELYMHNKEHLRLVSVSTPVNHWKIVSAFGNFYTAGEEIKSRRRLNNTLVLNGDLVSRPAYPRLWAFIQSLTFGQEVVSDATWLSNIKYRGCFSTGTNGTDFRLPDERGMFERMLDLGRGIDLSRQHPYAGGYEADAVGPHNHQYKRPRTDQVGTNYEGNHMDSGGDRGLYSGDNVNTDNNTGSTETIVKNIGKLNLIKY